jgi:hypothetical protein
MLKGHGGSRLAVLLVLLLAFASYAPMAFAGPTAQGVSSILSTWVQLGPGSAPIVRAVTDRPNCPAVTVGPQAQPMQLRVPPSAAFPVRICELTLPLGTTGAAIEGQSLPLPRPNPQRIVVVGDTGCRIEPPRGTLIQNCNNPQDWPFPRIAQTIAALQPDLVIHVGDVNDRDGPCPNNDPRCAGRPGGDNWPSWYDDFFSPAAPFLRVAPLVILRGNHEDCSRNGGGWFRLLDPHPWTVPCSEYSDPYAVALGNLQLLVLDSASARSGGAPPDQVATYSAQIATLRALATDPAWFVTHKGIRLLGQPFNNPTAPPFVDNETLQRAGALNLPPSVKLALAGHTHIVEMLEFNPPRPIQIDGSGGGDLLDPVPSQLIGVNVGDATVAGGFARSEFGFMTVVPTSPGVWSFTARDVAGAAVLSCLVQEFRAPCAGGVVPLTNPPPLIGQQGVPCTAQSGGYCQASGGVSGVWSKAAGGRFSFTATGPSTSAPSGVPAIFLPTTRGLEAYACLPLPPFAPFTVTCTGTTTGDVLQGAAITIRFPIAGGGAADVVGIISAPAVATPGVSPPAPVPPLPLPPPPPIVLPPPPILPPPPVTLPPPPLLAPLPALPAPVAPAATLPGFAEVPVIPEADSLLLLAGGLGVVGLVGWRAGRRRGP